MLTVLLFVIYFIRYKSIENLIIYGHKQKSLSNIFFINNGKARRQLLGYLILDEVSDKVLFISCTILDFTIILSASILM